MVEWLTTRNIQLDPKFLKPLLYEIIEQHKEQHIVYKFDNLIAQYGHVPLRLPPYYPDLNPIEMIWAQVKNGVGNKNVTFKLDDVKLLTEEEFTKVTNEKWKKYCEHVIKIEDKYLENEIHVDIITEELTITDSGSDSSDDEGFADDLPD